MCNLYVGFLKRRHRGHSSSPHVVLESLQASPTFMSSNLLPLSGRRKRNMDLIWTGKRVCETGNILKYEDARQRAKGKGQRAYIFLFVLLSSSSRQRIPNLGRNKTSCVFCLSLLCTDEILGKPITWAQARQRNADNLSPISASEGLKDPKMLRNLWPKRKGKQEEEKGESVLVTEHINVDESGQLAEHADDPIFPSRPRTNVMIWCSVIFCAVLCIIIILGGFVVLISYLAFHPHIPKFNVVRGSLNSIILDQSFILSSDATLLIEAHNPNDKIQLSYEYIKFELQFEKRTISSVSLKGSTTPIVQAPKNTTGFLLDMSTVALQLEAREGEDLSVLIQKNRVDFDLEGTIKTKSKFASITSVKYWVYTSCKLAFSPPPVGNGTLLTRHCRSTK